jgi:hypothetical protein
VDGEGDGRRGARCGGGRRSRCLQRCSRRMKGMHGAWAYREGTGPAKAMVNEKESAKLKITDAGAGQRRGKRARVER